MTCDPGALVLLPFPYADLSTTKKRPVLVLSRPDHHGDFIGLAVTSVPQPEPHLAIAADALSEGELPMPSWIRVDKVFTLEKSLILCRFGRLNSETLRRAVSALCRRVGHPESPGTYINQVRT
ncbi:type II toxin-antitoxin system PemK/MazF family toxin [Thiocapsa sp.]|uniref:type II toxin-antitoxin system PemK/MazF family toxin n=1 Tax=Thiocapsa sp. TaxID=2024551 RepID=UPI0035947A8B